MNSPNRPRGFLARALKVIGVLIVLLLIPVGVQYLRYSLPTRALPAERLTVVRTHPENVAPAAFDENAARVVRAQMEAAGMPGVSVAVVRGDSLLWAAGFGYADLEARRPVEIDSRFRLGSTAKALTGVLLGRLAERGAIDLDRPIGEILPDLPAHLAAVTARQLASHTAGVRHYRITDFNPYTGNPWRIAGAGLSIFANDALAFEPGTDFRYSTYGFTLLSAVLAAAGGAAFLDLIEREVCVPAGMTATGGDLPGVDVPGRVSFYTTSRGGKFTGAPPQNTSYKWAGGGLVGSALDLARLGRALADSAFISHGTRALIWTPVLLPGGRDNPQNYALGWRRDVSVRLLGEERPAILVHHGGIQPGGAAFLAILPEYGVTVAALTNTGSGDARGAVQELAYDLARLAIDGEIRAVAAR
jgi:CubicO group peptidase (beta-lactamase class C family)